MTTANEEQKPVRGDRVRIPDGREGKLLWIIPSGKEAAVELDGEAGSFHLPPDQLTLLPWFEGKLARGAIEVPEDDNGLVSATIPMIVEVLGGEPGKYAGKTPRILVDLHNGEIRFDDFTKELLDLPTEDEEAGECADCDALGCGPHTVHELEQGGTWTLEDAIALNRVSDRRRAERSGQPLLDALNECFPHGKPTAMESGPFVLSGEGELAVSRLRALNKLPGQAIPVVLAELDRALRTLGPQPAVTQPGAWTEDDYRRAQEAWQGEPFQPGEWREDRFPRTCAALDAVAHRLCDKGTAQELTKERAYEIVDNEMRYRLGVKRIDFTDAPACPVRVETAEGSEWHGCLKHAAQALRTLRPVEPDPLQELIKTWRNETGDDFLKYGAPYQLAATQLESALKRREARKNRP
jgi:hypothetical protein